MRRVPLFLVVSLLAACSGGAQNEGVATAEGDTLLTAALASYSPAVFDSIAWTTDTARTNRGAVVWSFSCKKCHGEAGRGDGGWVINGDTLRPPDFQQPGWRFATDEAELMKYVYTGNPNGMPHWGVEGLKPRNISAVAAYIQTLMVAPPPTAKK